MAGSLWFCVKGYSRLQTVVALSSAEAELFAIAEAAKEIAGLGQLASHIWGELTKPLAIYTDSASARQIAGMEDAWMAPRRGWHPMRRRVTEVGMKLSQCLSLSHPFVRHKLSTARTSENTQSSALALVLTALMP